MVQTCKLPASCFIKRTLFSSTSLRIMISSRILLYCVWVSKKKSSLVIERAVCVLPGTVDGRNHGKQVGRRERLDRMQNLCYFWWREVHVHVMLILSRSNFHPFLINTLILLNWSPTMFLYCLWMQANDLFFCEWLFINACSQYCTSVHTNWKE